MKTVSRDEAREIDCLVISPHLDDAALSLGASLWRFAQEGKRVLVVTLATAEPEGSLSAIALDLHRRWGLGAGAVGERRLEDDRACAVLGVEALHLGLTDALYRTDATGSPLYTSYRALFGEPHGGDSAWVAGLVDRFRQFPSARLVCAPLAAGHHVDHRLTRGAAEEVFGRRLHYYEDFPYSRKRWVRWKAMGVPWGWAGRTWPLCSEALAAKIRAITCYASQLRTAFSGTQDMEEQVRDFTAKRGGERLWFRR